VRGDGGLGQYLSGAADKATLLSGEGLDLDEVADLAAAGTRLLGSDLPVDLRDCGAFGPDPVAADRVLLKGGSTVAGPDGRILAGAALEDDLLFADLDLDLIAGEQHIMDVAGHYNRPDLFQLSVIRSPARQVTFLPGPVEADRGGAGAG
jgi:hypothetical protein